MVVISLIVRTFKIHYYKKSVKLRKQFSSKMINSLYSNGNRANIFFSPKIITNFQLANSIFDFEASINIAWATRTQLSSSMHGRPRMEFLTTRVLFCLFMSLYAIFLIERILCKIFYPISLGWSKNAICSIKIIVYEISIHNKQINKFYWFLCKNTFFKGLMNFTINHTRDMKFFFFFSNTCYSSHVLVSQHQKRESPT